MKIFWKWAACFDPDIYGVPDEIIEICNFAKISAIETNWRYTEGKTENEIIKLGDDFKKAGITLYSFHLPFTHDDDIASFYETSRIKAIQRLTNAIEQAGLLGCKAVVLHPTTNHFDTKIEGFDRYLSQMRKSLEDLVPVAEKLNIIISLENMLPRQGERFGSKIEHFKIFQKEFACKNLGFCFDTGHACVTYGSDGPAVFFDEIKENISIFHIQDNAGDRDLHIPPGRGLVNWNQFFKKMVQLKFSFPATIEAVPFSHAENSKFTKQAWKNMFEEVNAVAENALNF